MSSLRYYDDVSNRPCCCACHAQSRGALVVWSCIMSRGGVDGTLEPDGDDTL